MKKRARCNHSSAFKAKVALAAIKGDRTLAQLSEQFGVHPNQITAWKDQLVEHAAEVFECGASGKGSAAAVDIKTLHAKIGEALATAARLPTMYGFHEHVEDGGLMSYGLDLRQNWRRGAIYVDKILKGAKPGGLPVELPAKF